ncbi:MAG: LytTR family transcriptional regulator [Saprospiraceae bacterium]|nr:LytTR family transcriptional regulator [Saprospiraceae bacterium]
MDPKILCKTLKVIKAFLPPDRFLRIHKSYVVNAAHITEITQSTRESAVKLAGGHILPVSRNNKGFCKLNSIFIPIIYGKRNNMPELRYLSVIIFSFIHYILLAQCDNTFQFPVSNINVVCGYNAIAVNQWAGDFNITQGYQDQSFVTFSSSVTTDFLTIRKASDNSVIASGITPLSIVYDVSFGNLEMHINTNPACGTENVNRITALLVECGCNNSIQFPPGIFSLALGLNTITSSQWAGDYNVTTNYLDGAFCTFTSTVNTDYITLRKSSDNAILKMGLTPLLLVYDAAMGDIEMHISTNAACGTENVNRTTTIDHQLFNIYAGGNNDGFHNAVSLNQNPLPNIYAGGNNDGFHNTIALNQNPLPNIYTGGNNDGFHNTIALNQNPLPNIYAGGNNDGFHAVSLNQNPLPNIYTGGNNDGFQNTVALNQNPLPNIYAGGNNDGFQNTIALNQNPLPNIYTGGNNDGFHNTIALNQNPLPNIYTGGNNDGFHNTIAFNQNPDCSDNIVRWGGNVDTDWANPNNWDCGVLPAINSEVILQSGLDRYPTVSISYEIKKLHLKPLSSININPGVVFNLNGI